MMITGKHLSSTATAVLLAGFVCLSTRAQVPSTQREAAAGTLIPKRAYYVDPQMLMLAASIPLPPAPDSAQFAKELAEVHRIEVERTPAQVAAAQADDREEDIFIYRSIVGDQFTAERLPLTAQLSAHIHNDEPVIGNVIKEHFKRLRPYQYDKTIHPVCKLSNEPDSYPSGHSISGYLLGFALIQIMPEKSTEILARADEYARNRIVCGVHYPSDVEASRRVAYAIFGYILGTPKFQRDLTLAREEVHMKTAAK